MIWCECVLWSTLELVRFGDIWSWLFIIDCDGRWVQYLSQGVAACSTLDISRENSPTWAAQFWRCDVGSAAVVLVELVWRAMSVDNMLNKCKHVLWLCYVVMTCVCRHSWSSIQVSLRRPLPKPRDASTNQSRWCLRRRCLTMAHLSSRTLLWTSPALSSRRSIRCFPTRRKSVISHLSCLLVLLLVEAENIFVCVHIVTVHLVSK